MPTMMAVGVARPNEQGQAITNTETMAIKPWVRPLAESSRIQAINVISEMPMMVGTNTAAMRSTNACTGTLLPCASCTIRTIWAKSVSVARFLAR